MQTEYTNCPADIDRREAVYFPSAGVEYPPPTTFDFVGYEAADDGAIAVLTGAPWFDSRTFRDFAQISRYVTDWFLPGDVPVAALYSRVWRNNFMLRDSEISHHNLSRGLTARQQYIKEVLAHIYRIRGTVIFDGSENVDTWAARSNHEDGYVRRLAALPNSALENWRGRFMVTQLALLFVRTLLRMEFRYLRKSTVSNAHVFSQYIRSERRIRSRHGLIVPWQHQEFNRMSQGARRANVIPVTSHWRSIEVPRGFYAELPLVFSYVTSRFLDDRDSGFWVLAYTEFAAVTAAFLLWDAYDNRRLWYLSRHMIRFIRELDLGPVLGSAENYQEVLRFLNLIEAKDWSTVPESNSFRERGYSNRQDLSPGKTGSGGDFFHYDPWRNEEITAEGARERRNQVPTMPAGHPTGYKNVDDVEMGWEAGPANAEQGEDAEELGSEGGEITPAHVPGSAVPSSPSVSRHPGYGIADGAVA